MNPRKAALLIVDVQNDFCPGGALAVPDGDAVVGVLNRLMSAPEWSGIQVFASRDWHPRETSHFKPFGGAWPVHCVAGTSGAAFHPGLHLPPGAHVVTKGDEPGANGYSAFDGRLENGAALGAELRRLGIEQLIVGGLATDYCVKHSVMDARRLGFDVTVLADGIRGVDVQPGDSARALDEMKRAGAHVATTGELL